MVYIKCVYDHFVLKFHFVFISLFFMVLFCFMVSPVIVFADTPQLPPLPSNTFCNDSLYNLKEFFIVDPDYYHHTSQGMCIAGNYIIYTRFDSESSPTTYVVIDIKTRKEVAHYDFYTEHSNSLTYNPDLQEVVAVTNSKAYVFSFANHVLKLKTTHYLNHNCPKIAYVYPLKKYYLGTSTVVYSTTDFQQLKAEFSVPQLAVNQGMGFDGKFLYIPWYRESHNTVCVYDLTGNLIRTIQFDSDVYREIEEMDFHGTTMYVNMANSPGHNGISTVDSEHKYGDWKVLKPETCGDKGLQEHTCVNCGRVEQGDIPPNGKHKLTKWIPTKSPTCTEPGEHIKNCKVCKQLIIKEAVAPTGHDFTYWVRRISPTALHKGLDRSYCTKCDKSITQPVDALVPFIEVSEKYFLVRKGKKGQLFVRHNIGDYVTSWKSSDPEIASVSNDGTITGKSRGKCSVTVALASGLTKKIPVKVQFLPIFTEDLIVYKTGDIHVGEKKQVSAHKVPSTSFSKIKISSDSDCVQVSGNTLIGKKAGKAHITVKCWFEKREFDVTVLPAQTK